MAKTVQQIIEHIQGLSGDTSNSYSKEYKKFLDKLESQSSSSTEPTEETSVNMLEIKKQLDEIKYPGSLVIEKETTEATEAVEVVAVEPVQESYLLPAVSGAAGFILGAVLMAVYFKLKIKRIQKDCETRISEARTTLDRVLEMATK